MRKIVKRSSLAPASDGIALPFILIAMAGAISLTLGTLTRSLVDRQGSMRLSSSRSAKAVAESGLAKIQEELNRNYSSLLIKNLDEWPGTTVQICDNDATRTTSSDPNNAEWTQLREGTVGDEGKWSLINYNFNGSKLYGGEGTFEVQGEIEKSSKVMATATIKQSVYIRPKPCGCAFDQTCSSGFPGLYVQEGTLGGNDVLGKLGGNVVCVQCNTIEDLGQNSKSVVSGNIYLQDKDIPPVPTNPIKTAYPADPLKINGNKCEGSNCTIGGVNVLDKSGNIVITSQPNKAVGETELNGYCQYTDKGVVLNGGMSPPDGNQLICEVDSLLLKNNELIVNTESEIPIVIYFTGTGEVFNSSGNGGIRHINGKSMPTLLQLFGNNDPDDTLTDQSATLRGAADSNHLFVHFPDGNLGIAGGATNNTLCDDITGECTGGDIYGAVWAKTWGQTNGGSSGNFVQIVVPKELANAQDNKDVYITDYVSIGVTKWSNFEHIN